jgi:hypothetical protein
MNGEGDEPSPFFPTWKIERQYKGVKMPIKLKSPLEKEFPLEKSDAELGTTDGASLVTIRQATEGDYILVRDLTSEYKRSWDGKSIVSIQRISYDDIRKKQVYLTMSSCNIMDENGKDPLFKFSNKRLSSETEFNASWYKLPPVIADEIHEFVLQMNPLWDERIPQQPKPAPEKSGETSS